MISSFVSSQNAISSRVCEEYSQQQYSLLKRASLVYESVDQVEGISKYIITNPMISLSQMVFGIHDQSGTFIIICFIILIISYLTLNSLCSKNHHFKIRLYQVIHVVFWVMIIHSVSFHLWTLLDTITLPTLHPSFMIILHCKLIVFLDLQVLFSLLYWTIIILP